MSEHKVTVDWGRETPDFAYETYNRDHDWAFDAGITVRASANPAYLGSESCVDPRGGVRRQPLELPHADVPGDRRPQAVRRGRLPRRGGRRPGEGCGGGTGRDTSDAAGPRLSCS